MDPVTPLNRGVRMMTVSTVLRMRAAQFLQVENQLAILADLGIASEMPLVIKASPRR